MTINAENNPRYFLFSNIWMLTGGAGKTVKGMKYGIELEVEGKNVYGSDESRKALTGWTFHQDGSLRNFHGSCGEWVFSTPVAYLTALNRLKNLFEFFDQNKAGLVASNRTSTHIHVNMADKKGYQLVNLFIVFSAFEHLLDRFCGESRTGNLFCLGSRFSESQISQLHLCLNSGDLRGYPNNHRYSSLNLASLNKFNTVEFRGMRGVESLDEVVLWLKIINDLCTYAFSVMNNPFDFVSSLSLHGSRNMVQEVFKNTYQSLINFCDEDFENVLYDNIRRLQLLISDVSKEMMDYNKAKHPSKDYFKIADPEIEDEDEDGDEEIVALAIHVLENDRINLRWPPVFEPFNGARNE